MTPTDQKWHQAKEPLVPPDGASAAGPANAGGDRQVCFNDWKARGLPDDWDEWFRWLLGPDLELPPAHDVGVLQ